MHIGRRRRDFRPGIHGIDLPFPESGLDRVSLRVRVSLIGRRKEILHKRWDENVYQPIQDQINRKLNAEYDSFLERKNNIYDQYLNVSIICYLEIRNILIEIQVVNKKSICNSKVGFQNRPRAMHRDLSLVSSIGE